MLRVPTLALASLLLGSALPRLAAAQDLTELARKAKHSVVALKVKDRFGRELGQGSGFFVDPEGLIVTNYHVVDVGPRIEAHLSNDRSLEVLGIVASDETRDLAVIKVDSGPFPSLSLADSDAVETGQQVVVLGNPLGLSGTLSEGIVSAVRDGEEIRELHDGPLLQITAAISPGSSGSPVMNLDGEVVGVAVSQAVFGQNLNFAVPSSAVRELLLTVDPSAAPRRLGGGEVVRAKSLVYLRNVGISLVFFAAVYFGYRRLR